MQLQDPVNHTQYRCAYDQAHMKPFLHTRIGHKLVLDHLPGYWRECADRDRSTPRLSRVLWEDIIFVDFKIHSPSRYCDRQWQDLDRVLNNGQHYHVLHAVADDWCGLSRSWIVHRLNSLEFTGDLYLDLVDRWANLSWDQHRQRGRNLCNQLAPLIARCAGVDHRTIDQGSGLALHTQFRHPRGVREFWEQYD